MEIEKPRRATYQEITQALSRWDILESSPILNATPTTEKKSEFKLAVSNWLYDLVRQNVKRGRIFQLRDVLLRQEADCLGYAKLMNCLGKRFGLDTGIIEVIIDNGGRYVTHYVNLVKFPAGRKRFIDLWYGSRDIRHRRIGAQIKEQGLWRIRDLDLNELDRVKDVRGLPSTLVDGVTHYILGNRYLEEGIRDASAEKLDRAIAHYDRAIRLYPGYARAHFNRAVAYDNKREYEKASLDYAQALKDDAAQIRVLAREHEEINRLMELDRAGIKIRDQEIYLWRRGVITGEQVASADIAKSYGMSESEVDQIIASIEARLTLPQSKIRLK